eukprot:403370720
MKKLQFTFVLMLSFLTYLSNALSFRTKGADQYCFTINGGKKGQFLHIEYEARGRNTESIQLKFKSTTFDYVENSGKKFSGVKEFPEDGQIKLCFKQADSMSKTINWYYEIREDAKRVDKKNEIGLDHIHEAQSRLSSILSYFSHISKNIYRKSEDDKEIAEIGTNTRKTQKYLSFIKLLIVALLCAGQVYFITLFFTSGQKRRVQSRVVQSGI